MPTNGFCEGCGTSLGQAASFCGACGRPKVAPAVPPPPAVPAFVAASPVPTLPANVVATGAQGQQVALASFGQRWLAAFIDQWVFIFTLGIGWLIWSWITSEKGQSPGKMIVGLRIVQQETGTATARGEAFGRGVLKAVFDIVSMFLLYIPMGIAAGMFFSDPLHRTPWDRMMKTLVVHDPTGRTLPSHRPAHQPLAA